MLEAKDLIGTDVQIDALPLVIGAAVSAVVGLLSIGLVKVIVKNDKFKIFGIYTLILGIACIGIGIYENVTGTHIFFGV